MGHGVAVCLAIKRAMVGLGGVQGLALLVVGGERLLWQK